MVSSLWTAASGMNGQQLNIDSISNNLANVNTTAYKKTRTDFQDLFYQRHRLAGTNSDHHTLYPAPIEIGTGVKPASTQKLFVQGALQKTDAPFDLAIMGEGFFAVRMPDSSLSYTRDGSFKIDSNGQLLTSDGYFVDPPIQFDPDLILESVKITEDGYVYYKTRFMAEDEEPIIAGQIQLNRFVNPAGLASVGKNLYKETIASGEAQEGAPADSGYGNLQHRFLEMSNVQIVEEMVSMIVAQRAYEFNSKSIQTSDSMLATAVNMKR